MQNHCKFAEVAELEVDLYQSEWTVFFEQLHQIGKASDRRALEIENRRSLPPDLAEVLIDSGMIRLWVAGRYGGAQASVESLLDGVETLAYYNGSLAWVALLFGKASRSSDCFAMCTSPLSTALFHHKRWRWWGRWGLDCLYRRGWFECAGVGVRE